MIKLFALAKRLRGKIKLVQHELLPIAGKLIASITTEDSKGNVATWEIQKSFEDIHRNHKLEEVLNNCYNVAIVKHTEKFKKSVTSIKLNSWKTEYFEKMYLRKDKYKKYILNYYFKGDKKFYNIYEDGKLKYQNFSPADETHRFNIEDKKFNAEVTEEGKPDRDYYLNREENYNKELLRHLKETKLERKKLRMKPIEKLTKNDKERIKKLNIHRRIQYTDKRGINYMYF